MRRLTPAFVLGAFLLSACSSGTGGGGAIPPAASSPAISAAGVGAARPSASGNNALALGLKGSLPVPTSAHLLALARKKPHHGKAKVVLKIHWKHKRVRRRPDYIPATARSISISINGGIPQYANSPDSTLTVNSPVGTDTFYIATYDEQNGTGQVLSYANVTQDIVAGQANQISVTLNAVIAQLAVAVDNPSFPAGTSATMPLNVVAYDPDGNIIVGDSDYAEPIKLSITDPANTGTLSLSTPILQNPAQTANLAYNGETLVNASVTASAQGATPGTEPLAPTPTIYELPVAGEPQYIAAANDGTAWYTDSNNTVVHITQNGALSPFAIPSGNSNPQGIILGENGNMWFTEYNTSKIAEVSSNGSISEFGTLFGNDSPQMLTDRGDQTIWYAGYGGNHIGYVNQYTGAAGETTMPTGGSGPWDLAEGPDGNLYITENLADEMARAQSLFTNPFPQTAVSGGSESESIVRGPDNNMWFTQPGLNAIGVISTSSFSEVASYPTASASSVPIDITVGKDKNLWYTEAGLDRVAVMNTSGQTVAEYTTPSTNTGLKGIATGSDGAIWFCESNTSKVGRLVY